MSFKLWSEVQEVVVYFLGISWMEFNGLGLTFSQSEKRFQIIYFWTIKPWYSQENTQLNPLYSTFRIVLCLSWVLFPGNMQTWLWDSKIRSIARSYHSTTVHAPICISLICYLDLSNDIEMIDIILKLLHPWPYCTYRNRFLEVEVPTCIKMRHYCHNTGKNVREKSEYNRIVLYCTGEKVECGRITLYLTWGTWQLPAHTQKINSFHYEWVLGGPLPSKTSIILHIPYYEQIYLKSKTNVLFVLTSLFILKIVNQFI